MIFLWAVFIVGPDTMLPLHHRGEHVITFIHPDYHLECRQVPVYNLGEPP